MDLAPTMDITTPMCPRCRRIGAVRVPVDGYEAWRAGTHIQNAFPEMPADKREMLITGIHPQCWEELFGKPEE